MSLKKKKPTQRYGQKGIIINKSKPKDLPKTFTSSKGHTIRTDESSEDKNIDEDPA